MNDYLKWILPVGLVCLGFIAGLIFEKFIFNKLKRFATKTRLPGNEILFLSLRGIPKIWFVIAGFYAAVISLQVSQVIDSTLADILQKILTAIFLFTVTIALARLTASFVNVFTQRTEGVSASLLSNLARIVVFVFGILTILQTLGFSITPILATLGIGGLAVALAFQDTLSNLFSGLYLIISKQVRTGDYVKLETGQEGYVTDITWRNTVIQELPHNVIIVPNSKLASAIFTNYHLPAKEIIVLVEVGVSYDSDLDQVEWVTFDVAQEVMQKVSGSAFGFEPFIRYHTLSEYSIRFTVFLRANEFLDQRVVKHEFIKRLHRRYQEEGIVIPFPTRTVYYAEQPFSN
ncbi:MULTISPECIES: mechanosensitive ion channel family protein [Aerosakkonema]|uniref:mechanosensitive ion channel family protein n=1 Tax=Aerosakkonema TaxID=1246629 RepID=UPI0035BA6C6F